MIIAWLTGCAAGLLHVISGPDHLGAVAPLALVSRKNAWLEGLRWGCGHSLGVVLIGAAALLFRSIFPLTLVSAGGERLVGVLLIGVGVWTWFQARKITIHCHSHEHDGVVHDHVHLHISNPRKSAHRHFHAALGIGTLHGIAGSSHLIGVLPTLAFPTWLQSAAYLAGFCGGTMVAMSGFASGLGWIAQRFSARGWMIYRGMMMTSSICAIALGGWWIWSTARGQNP